ncbi:MAG: citrate (Si)-synthase [Candidatus Hydrogenedentota bacterium]
MGMLAARLAELIPGMRTHAREFVKAHGSTVISEVTVEQICGGMRGVRSIVCDTSSVEPDTGLTVRGYPILDLVDKTPQETLWLLLTGEMPTPEQAKNLTEDLAARREVPDYVWDILESMPRNSHPMTMLCVAINSMAPESKFRNAYENGAKKEDYWITTLEDCLDLVARVPVIAAGIYRIHYEKGPRIEGDLKLPLSLNFARLLGIKDPSGQFADLIRLYLVLHSDHEGANVSAMTTAVVNSALSDLYLSLAAGLNGLAGPLHGLANQDCIKWILMVHEKFNGVPTDEQVEKFAWETLNAGHVIPGYGHAVLRITDPRFDAFYDFGKKFLHDDPVFQIVRKVFEIVPGVLQQVKKIKDPWPNVDAVSGSLLYHYGMTEFPFYTVLFGVSRTIGVASQAVLARALGAPIFRPKSITMDVLEALVTKKDAVAAG